MANKLLSFINCHDFHDIDPPHVCTIYDHEDRKKLETIRELLQKKASIDEIYQVHKYPLHLAVIFADIDIADQLVNQGMQIDCLDNKYRCNPLQLAITYKQFEIINFLIDKGADVHALDMDNRTTLHLAAISGNLEIVKLLAQKGVDIHAVDDKENTALHLIFTGSYFEITRFLIEKGIDIHRANGSKRTALHLAVLSQNCEAIELLIAKGADIHVTDGLLETPLHKAVRLADLEAAYLLLNRGANFVPESADYYQSFLNKDIENSSIYSFGEPSKKKTMIMLAFASGAPEKLDQYAEHFSDMQYLRLRKQFFGHTHQNATWARHIFEIYRTLPFTYYYQQFLFRQKLLDQITNSNPKIRWLYWVIALNCQIQNPWLQLFRYLNKTYSELPSHLSTYNWYDEGFYKNGENDIRKTIISRLSQESRIALANDLEETFRDFIINQLSTKINLVDTLIEKILELPRELQDAILQITLSEGFFERYHTILPPNSSRYRQMCYDMQNHKDDVFHLHQWSSEINKMSL